MVASTTRAVLAGLVAFFAALPIQAQAIYLSESGDTAKLVGPIVPGDEKVFAEFLAQPRPKPIRVLYLDSFGGGVDSGIAIARMVRKAKLVTALDAVANRCVSACTLIFAAGVKRHNVHGEQVEEGYNSASGLGYHTAYFKGDLVHFATRSDKGADMMNKLYAEMGSPGAAGLAARGRGSSIYHPSGATSLALKIATSLAEP